MTLLVPALDEIRDAFAALRRGELTPDDVYHVREAAEWHGVLALFAHEALRSDAGSIPARQWLAEHLRGEAAADAARCSQTRRAIDCLGNAGVPAIVLKGAHLAHAVYETPFLRPQHDLDLLIRDADRTRVATALHEAGYKLLPHVRGDLILAQMHFYREMTSGARHAIDVHWRALNPHPFRQLLPFDDVLAPARPVPELGAHARGLSFPHALLLACVHLAAHHSGAVRAIWLCDVDGLARRLDESDWEVFVEGAVQDRVSAIVSDVLRLSVSLLDSPVPAPMLEALAAGRQDERLTAAYLRPRSRAGLLLLDLRAIDRWGDRIRYLGQHLWPDRDYMLERYGAGGASLWAYVGRAAGGAAAWLRRPERDGRFADPSEAAARPSSGRETSQRA